MVRLDIGEREGEAAKREVCPGGKWEDNYRSEMGWFADTTWDYTFRLN